MNLSERIAALNHLGGFIEKEISGSSSAVIDQAISENRWFTQEGVRQALKHISKEYLDSEKLTHWASHYTIVDTGAKKVGLVLAGNIPLVGLHDIISVFISGHIAIIKYSHKDKALLSWLIGELAKFDPRTTKYFIEAEQLKDIEVVIATGGQTANTHFKYYFSKYPHIIRNNRNSIAILTGSETPEQLKGLGADIFTYFGLGCRNVSKLYVPTGYNIHQVFESITDYADVIHHHKYKNNFDYSYAIYLLGKHPFLTNNFLILREHESLSSRIACIHYEYYESIDDMVEQVKGQEELIQCVASIKPISDLPFTPLGTCQSPGLMDYADQVDVMSFLTGLYD